MGCLVPRFGGAPLLCFGTFSSLSSSLEDNGFGFLLTGRAAEESESGRLSWSSFASVITGEPFDDRSMPRVSVDLAEGGECGIGGVRIFSMVALLAGAGSSSVSVAESKSICFLESGGDVGPSKSLRFVDT